MPDIMTAWLQLHLVDPIMSNSKSIIVISKTKKQKKNKRRRQDFDVAVFKATIMFFEFCLCCSVLMCRNN